MLSWEVGEGYSCICILGLFIPRGLVNYSKASLDGPSPGREDYDRVRQARLVE